MIAYAFAVAYPVVSVGTHSNCRAGEISLQISDYPDSINTVSVSVSDEWLIQSGEPKRIRRANDGKAV
jgi:hypothetical protein